jgi:hypothetical protein
MLLEGNNTDYSHMRDLLKKYEEVLSASDLLEDAENNSSLNEPEITAQELHAEDAVVKPADDSTWTKEEALLESTVVSNTHLHLVDGEDPNKVELQLAVLDVKGRVTEIEISPKEGERLVIGRTRARPLADVGLAIDDTSISSKHCEINWTNTKGWTLIDFGTTNGTELNGEPVLGEICMTKIGEIRLGDSVIKFFPKDQQEKLMETMRLIVEH